MSVASPTNRSTMPRRAPRGACSSNDAAATVRASTRRAPAPWRTLFAAAVCSPAAECAALPRVPSPWGAAELQIQLTGARLDELREDSRENLAVAFVADHECSGVISWRRCVQQGSPVLRIRRLCEVVQMLIGFP